MAGFVIPGQRYQDPSTGQWGTAQEHAERQRQSQIQQPYDESRPSPGAANDTLRQANSHLDFNIDPTGRLAYTNQSEQARKMAELQAKLAADAEARRVANSRQDTASQQAIKDRDRASLLGLISKGNTPTATVKPNYGSASGEADARAAAFARAKDQAGKIARASLESIAQNVASRGISGSGIEALMGAGAIGSAAEPLQDLTAAQMASDFNRAGQVTDMRYQGDIAQRGQDMNQRQSYLQLLKGLFY